MSKSNDRRVILIITIVLIVVSIGVYNQFSKSNLDTADWSQKGKQRKPAPVETVEIVRGPIEFKRSFSGTLEAHAEFIIAPKVAGRVERLTVNLADPVNRGQLVVELDNAEYIQSVTQAKAELAVAEANLVEAKSALQIAKRDLSRVETLRERGVVSVAQLDAAQAEELAKKSKLEVSRAEVLRSEATLETARIRLGYTKIKADWSGGEEQRVVAERFVNEGEAVSANTPLLRIVELDPISGVVFVAERDYGRLKPEQEVLLETDAFPGQIFVGAITRIAPVFKEETRQARVELSIDNPERRLKPGMFVRATIVLDKVSNAVIVAEQAITKRNDRTGVFLVKEDGNHVRWQEVTIGIRDGKQVQLHEDLTGEVVTLGQQLLDDGSAITRPGEVSNKPSQPGESEQR